jgi:hypothetical protein
LEDGVKSERLKCEFSQVEEVLDLQKIPKLIPIPNKKNTTKKKIVMKKKKKKPEKKKSIVYNKKKKP